MQVLFPDEPVSLAALSTWLEARGFEIEHDGVPTNRRHDTVWISADDSIGLLERADHGTWTLTVHGPREEELFAALTAFAPGRTGEQVLAGARAGRLEQLRRVFQLGTLVGVDAALAERATSELLAKLDDSDELVRWAVLSGLPVSRPALAKLEAAAEKYPDLASVLPRMRELLEAVEDGTVHDEETDDRFELIDRAAAGAEAGQWKRVARATDAVLAESPWDHEALLLRGLAHDGLGEPLEALFLVGAVERDLSISEEASRRLRAGEVEMDPDIDPDLLDEATMTDRERQLLERARAVLPGLCERHAPGVSEGAKELIAHFITEWARSSHGGLIEGGAKALRGRVPELEGVLAYAESKHDRDHAPRLLEEAAKALPRSPSIAIARAMALLDTDPTAGEELLIELRAELAEPRELSYAESLVEELAETGLLKQGPPVARILEVLARRAYDRADYDRAAELASDLVEMYPETVMGWVIRANALIFALRHEEAIGACDEAIAILEPRTRDGEAIVIGPSPVPQLVFNRACVLAKLGRRDAAIAGLRDAIRLDDKFADDAPEDDYFESLFEDPEFLALCARDPAALRTEEERDPLYLKRLLATARELENRGDLRGAERGFAQAVEVANERGDLDALAEALALHGRAQLFLGDGEGALASSDEALALVEEEDITPLARATVFAQRGICLQGVGELEEAQASYERAYAERREALGDGHPDLLKSLSAMMGLAIARQRPAGEIEALAARGIDLATAFLDASPPKDHVWAEVVDSLASMLRFRAGARLAEGRQAETLDTVELLIDRLEAQRAAGFTPTAPNLDAAEELTDTVRGSAGSPEIADRANSLLGRLYVVIAPGPAAERGPRLVFHRLRGLITQARQRGIPDAELAQILTGAIKGGDALAPDVAALRPIADFRTLVAEAIARDKMVLITSAMALEMAANPGELDRSLHDLEELIVPVVTA